MLCELNDFDFEELIHDLESSIEANPSTPTLTCNVAMRKLNGAPRRVKSAYICYVDANVDAMWLLLGSDAKVSPIYNTEPISVYTKLSACLIVSFAAHGGVAAPGDGLEYSLCHW